MSGCVRPALRWAAALGWLGVIVAAHAQGVGPVRVLEPMAGWVASLTQASLHSIGIAARRAGTLLYVPGGFAYDVNIGCTGLLPAAVLAVAILASPGTTAAKQRGLLVGVPLVLAVNLLRLVHLFYIGVHAPGHFALAHSLLWEVALVLFTFATWLAWSSWAGRAGQRVRLAMPPSSWISG